MTVRKFLALVAISLTVGACSDAGSSPNLPGQNPSQPGEQPPPGQRPPKIDFAAAAKKLGVTEAKLKQALGVPANPTPGTRPPDLKAAAAKLGVTEAKLREALAPPPPATSNSPG